MTTKKRVSRAGRTAAKPPAARPERPADLAYAWVSERIYNGTFTPGAHLKEAELASGIGVSRTPVRDALRRLAGEGLVVTERERGTYVASFSAQEVDDIFQLRAALEGYGAALAVKRIGAAEIARMEELASQMEALTAAKGAGGGRGGKGGGVDLARLTALNNAFHRVILDAAGSRRLAAMLGPLIDIPVLLLKHYNWHGRVDPERSNRQHREIIDAFRAGDPIWVRTRMQSHIISTRPRGSDGAPSGPDMLPDMV
ncbi:MAG: GntR family transcriptional regulator [Hyphomicrobium sp.]|nr:GntR family transcriptional regulator [Hyphomicrobium sp.]